MDILTGEEMVKLANKWANGRDLLRAAGWEGSGWTKVWAVIVRCDIGYAAFSIDTFGDTEQLNGGNLRDLWQQVSRKAQSDVTFGR
jgi:hypothetical protein